jgi:hypothetical protein
MLDKVKSFIQELEERDFYKYLAGFLVGIVLLMALIVYLGQRKITLLKKRANKINTQRQSLQEILTTFERVKQQKADVAAILEKDKTFKIIGYLDHVIASMNLGANKAGGVQQSEEPLEHLPEYSEIKVVVPFTNLNMKQLAELLQEIEKNERIYTKELDITKSPSKPTIDATLTIATLQARTEAGTE